MSIRKGKVLGESSSLLGAPIPPNPAVLGVQSCRRRDRDLLPHSMKSQGCRAGLREGLSALGQRWDLNPAAKAVASDENAQ